MTDTSRRNVMQTVCTPIAAVAAGHVKISEANAKEMIEIITALVTERDAMSTGLAFIASKGVDLSGDAIETIARQALAKK